MEVKPGLWHDVHDGQVARGLDQDAAARLADRVQDRMRARTGVKLALRDAAMWWISHIYVVCLVVIAGSFAVIVAALTGGGPAHHPFAGMTTSHAINRADTDLTDWYNNAPGHRGNGNAWAWQINLLSIRRVHIGGVGFLRMRYADPEYKRHVCINESRDEFYVWVCK